MNYLRQWVAGKSTDIDWHYREPVNHSEAFVHMSILASNPGLYPEFDSRMESEPRTLYGI